ncbi:5-formaminoimidazole-4-carboxamide-1-(beta)-D-ribofuranosyl 5'-monophosphate synthetase [Candidatus Woesearchaeota archaeon]|nr:5-formaminoimidazole-4-carboxamide-1-(beta)-D-ribofuranosyl 5'-monophosphate synthetase [Candidatus Woesearchaeota archaeon]
MSYKIATLGSHSALQILKGAKDEGFETIAICEKGREKPYKSFRVADEIITLNNFSELTKIESKLREKNAILIPHGTYTGVMSQEAIERLKVAYFGNRKILKWEYDRTLQRDWLKKAGLTLPKIFKKPEDIDRPVIIKFFGARGGKGFFLAKTTEEFYRKLKAKEAKKYIIQEYVIGAPIYIHYFYSPITDELEIMSFDKRYESNVDSIGRIAAKDQLDMGLDTSYNITGNVPIVVRESLLPEIFEMGESVVKASKKLEKQGMVGPFSLETVITPDLKFYVFEISARIVAGTNFFINSSPYADLRYNGQMSTGRRIAREIKIAIEKNKLGEVLI